VLVHGCHNPPTPTMAARPFSVAWPLAGETATPSTGRRERDEEGYSDTSTVAGLDEKTAAVGTTELYENGQIRLIPVSCSRDTPDGIGKAQSAAADHLPDAHSGSKR
jgi:hypothetical protein